MCGGSGTGPGSLFPEQKPIKDLVSQLWVFRYTSALVKIAMGHTRGKYTGTNLFGGQTVNHQDVMRQGEKEKDELEKELMSNYVDTDPVRFFIGIFTALLSIGQFFI